MKNINIHIIGIGYNNKYQAYIKLYDKNSLISEGHTFNGIYNVCLYNKAYKILIYFNNKVYSYIFIPKKDIYLKVNYITIQTFILTDKYYIGLPIMKGEISLWPK